MKRWAFHILSTFSLLLFLTTATMWVRSLFVEDNWIWGTDVVRSEFDETRATEITSASGGVRVYRGEGKTSGSPSFLAWLSSKSPGMGSYQPSGQMKWTSRESYGYPTREETTLGFSWKREQLDSSFVPDDSSFPENRQKPVRIQSLQRTLVFPYWLPLLISVPPLVPWMTRAWRKLRERKQCVGRCRVCSYDLRASPERCPECGTVVEPSN